MSYRAVGAFIVRLPADVDSQVVRSSTPDTHTHTRKQTKNTPPPHAGEKNTRKNHRNDTARKGLDLRLEEEITSQAMGYLRRKGSLRKKNKRLVSDYPGQTDDTHTPYNPPALPDNADGDDENVASLGPIQQSPFQPI